MKIIQGEYRKSKEYILTEFKNNYFEFHFPYTEELRIFKEEFNRFICESKGLTRFKNKYPGNVVVNLSEWIDKPINEYFTAFMYFLVDRTFEFKNSKLIFICEKICSHELLSTLEDYFDTKIQLIDLGVKTKDNHKNIIGFIIESKNKENCEDRNV